MNDWMNKLNFCGDAVMSLLRWPWTSKWSNQIRSSKQVHQYELCWTPLAVYNLSYVLKLNWAVFMAMALCNFVNCVWTSAGLQSPVPHSPIPPAALISLLRFFLSLHFSHIPVCSFPILQDWHILLLHNTYQMKDVTGADEEEGGRWESYLPCIYPISMNYRGAQAPDKGGMVLCLLVVLW